MCVATSTALAITGLGIDVAKTVIGAHAASSAASTQQTADNAAAGNLAPYGTAGPGQQALAKQAAVYGITLPAVGTAPAPVAGRVAPPGAPVVGQAVNAPGPQDQTLTPYTLASIQAQQQGPTTGSSFSGR
jgi:hypothetical protein